MEIVEALHIVGAVFLVGPVAMAGMYAPRYIRSGNAGGLDLLRRVTLTFGAGTVLVGLLGFGLVTGEDGGPGFGEPWVIASIALWAVAVGLTLLVLLPALRDAGEAAAAADNSAAASLVGRAMLGGMLPTVLYLAVAILMVTKPGA